jgi:hypothetical protein
LDLPAFHFSIYGTEQLRDLVGDLVGDLITDLRGDLICAERYHRRASQRMDGQADHEVAVVFIELEHRRR